AGAQMIFKLSLKNLKAHVPNYLVYYISMTFAAVVYYCFRAIAKTGRVRVMCHHQNCGIIM
ncbi:hypothetical protein, partial [Listeria monocytogenes]|uniref:hypothetical protein n=1 Tax=Listeria monocytogenes TaxID=1639 RepID=UPI003D650D2E